ncbi:MULTISPECIES: hypothetical protein [Prauserella salsuginis group]|uniref:Excreted virulence factor EspC (Type VII ESX diderm) n=2 Tax=Prauserella salsuginis group TaxID=2893672 RepID=A0A839XLZ8_9PSEU|nr:MULTISPECIES: hypothetical protein [Prauserella salsuginis group]MBB3663657.1 hypothetical protein [Prauserella sediminis]MCR3722562.1 hypothetical protein [Prauserella flava]MCR3737004.1 hypothetical protein [Prauserella salsuginis]
MTSGHEVQTSELRGYASLTARQANNLKAIGHHAREKGGDTSGYTGLLALLAPVVTGVVELYGETLEFAHGKMNELTEKVAGAADKYEGNEADQHAEIQALGGKLDAVDTNVRGSD